MNTPPEPLSARLLAQADDLRRLAHLCYRHSPTLATALVLNAARVGLASVAAQQMERDLRGHQRALEEMHANEQEEEASAGIAARHARARTIANIMAPVLAGIARPDAGPEADAE